METTGLCIARTKRLVLRQVAAQDAEFLVVLLNDPAWLANIGERGVRTAQQAQIYIRDKFIGSYLSFGFGMYLVELLDGGDPIGLCGLVKRDSLPCPDLGFALLPQFRNRGYAFEACEAILGYARDVLKLSRLLGIVKAENVASCRLLERLRFVHEGSYRPPNEAIDLKLYGFAPPSV